MADSDFSSPSSRIPPGLPRFLPPGRGDGITVRIESADGDLADVQRAVRIAGEIVRRNEDGTVRIHTDKGNVDVRVRGRDTLTVGQKVEIDIPPGQPPRQAVIRPAPPQTQPLPQTPAPEATTPTAPPPKQALPVAQTTTPAPDSDDIALPPELIAAQIEAETEINALFHKENENPAAPKTATSPPPPALRAAVPLILPETETLAGQLPPQQKILPVPLPLIAGDIVRLAALAPDAPVIVPQSAAPILARSILAALPPFPDATARPIQNANAAPEKTIAHHAPALSALDVMIAAVPSVTGDAPGLFTTRALSAAKIIAGTVAKALADIGLPLSAPPASPAQAAAAPVLRPQTHAHLNAAGSPLTAEIVGKTPEGLPVLKFDLPVAPHETPQTPIQTNIQTNTRPHLFVLPFPVEGLQPGAIISIVPQETLFPAGGAPVTPHISGTTPGAVATALPVQPLPVSGWPAPAPWAAFDDLIQAVQQAAPQTVATMTHSILPHPTTAPSQIPPALLLFLAAARAGDIAGWLGDKTLDVLRRGGKGDLIDRLTRDVAGLTRDESGDSSAPSSSGWRSTPLPVAYQDHIYRMMLHYRHDRDDDTDGGDGDKRGTRFIFDLSFPRMGAVQIDGLHRSQKLDLVVRTAASLSPAMQQEMRRLWVRALEPTELKGELSFQNRPEQFVKIGNTAPTQNVSA